MPTYLIVNRNPATFEPGPDAFAAWTQWFEGLGAHLGDRGNPAFTMTTAGNCGPGTRLSGYTLITAVDLEEAKSLAASHPLMSFGGGVEIGELTLPNVGRDLLADGAARHRHLTTRLRSVMCPRSSSTAAPIPSSAPPPHTPLRSNLARTTSDLLRHGTPASSRPGRPDHQPHHPQRRARPRPRASKIEHAR